MIGFSSDVTDLHFHRNKRAIVRNMDSRGPSRCSEHHSLISHHLLIKVGVSVDSLPAVIPLLYTAEPSLVKDSQSFAISSSTHR